MSVLIYSFNIYNFEELLNSQFQIESPPFYVLYQYSSQKRADQVMRWLIELHQGCQNGHPRINWTIQMFISSKCPHSTSGRKCLVRFTTHMRFHPWTELIILADTILLANSKIRPCGRRALLARAPPIYIDARFHLHKHHPSMRTQSFASEDKTRLQERRAPSAWTPPVRSDAELRQC